MFRLEVRVAGVKSSPVLMWTTVFCSMYTYSLLLCMLRYNSWIEKTKLFIRYMLYGLNLWHARFDISNLSSSLSHYALQFANRLYIWYINQTIIVRETFGKLLSPYMQQNGAVLSNNGNWIQLQITNQYALPLKLSILLLLCPTVCCTRIQSVCPIDSISIQFVTNRLLPVNCCWMLTV